LIVREILRLSKSTRFLHKASVEMSFLHLEPLFLVVGSLLDFVISSKGLDDKLGLTIRNISIYGPCTGKIFSVCRTDILSKLWSEELNSS